MLHSFINNGKQLTISLLLILFFIFSVPSMAQERPVKNQFRGDVQLLSDGQLNSFWSNAKQLGYDFRTVTTLLQEGGFSYTEALGIVERIRKLESTTSSDPFSVLQNLPDDEMTAYEKKIFGLKLFYQGEFEFTDYNFLPTPDNYQLGVGDEITVVLYGETDANYTLAINKEGKVQIPFEGPFSLLGLSFSAAKSLIKQKLSAPHAGLVKDEPTVFLDFTLTNARAITINILGEVLRPGSYSVPSTSSVFNALYRAGGPTTKGTLRNIKVYRSNNLVAEMDLYKFIREGFVDQTLTLRDQDVIVLDTYKKRIELLGGIRNPGIYELDEEEKIADLLEMAGGFSAGADTSAVVLRRLNGSPQFIKGVDLKYETKNLNDGDVITVPKIRDYNIDRIEISGAVNRPGFYSFSSNMSLADLLEAAGGLRSDAFESRIAIFQLKDNLKPMLQAVNLKTTDPTNYRIDERSTVYVPSTLSLTEPGFITIEGGVSRTGQIPYYEGMSALDAIILADGINETAVEGKMEIVRRRSLSENDGYDYFLLDLPPDLGNLQDFELQPRDRIFVRDNWLSQVEKTINVQGEVEQPGKFVINPGVTRVSDVIERTGGFFETANLNGLKLYRLIKSIDDTNDSTVYERKNSIARFINDPRFEGSVSTLQYDASNNAFSKLQNDRILALRKETKGGIENQETLESDSIGVLNNFKLSKTFILNNESTELLEIGLSYEEIMADPNSQYNVTLLDGDILFVPPRSALVEIDGNVFRPTQAIYRSDKNFRDYIETAGGYKRNADRKRAYIEYANGEIKRVRSFLFVRFYPPVETDSRIIVPEKPATAGFNYERVISLITTTITTYLLIEAVSTGN